MNSRCFSILVYLALAVDLSAQEAPVRGAKELFYDPADESVAAAPAAIAESSAEGSTTLMPAGPARSRKRTRHPIPQAGRKQTILGLRYWIELVGSRNGAGTPVTDSSVFKSGEKIRLHFRSNAPGRIALIQLGSHGAADVLFPDPAKGLVDSRIAPDEDRVLPGESFWFRFDNHPGTERILVLFAKDPGDLEAFPVKGELDHASAEVLVKNAEAMRHSKDLILETESANISEVGTYGVNIAGKPVILEITLHHE